MILRGYPVHTPPGYGKKSCSVSCLKKNLNASRPSEHPPVRGEKISKRLCRIIGFSFLFFNLTYSRWTSSLPSCLWSLRIFPSLPGSRLTNFYRDASSALSQLVNQWLNFTFSRSHAFRYERKNTKPTLARIELTTSALPSRCAGYLLDHSGDCKDKTSSWHLIGFTDGSNYWVNSIVSGRNLPVYRAHVQ